jgi:L-seryl-tRNA(Ser) seleniumtransferase
VHTSNFRLVGFTSQVDSKDLKALGEKYNLPVMEDLGSGVLIDLKPFGLPEEPTVQASVKVGMDIITFSGDKLLGGPQAGIIIGKKELVERIKRHPLTRAVRIDKLTLAALEAVLRFYKDEEWQKIPVLSMLTKSRAVMEAQAQKLAAGIADVLGKNGNVEVVEDVSQAGGGALPGANIPTVTVAVGLEGIPAQELAQRLRNAPTPIIGRIKRDRFLLDLRTLNEKDIEKVIEMVRNIL